MPVPLAFKLALAVAAGAAAAAMSDLSVVSSPPPFETVSLTLANGRQLEAGRDEITYALWKSCHDAGGCEHLPPAPSADGNDYPVTRVNGQDIEQYLSLAQQERPRKLAAADAG